MKKAKTKIAMLVMILMAASFILSDITVSASAGIYDRAQPWPSGTNLRDNKMASSGLDNRWASIKNDYIYVKNDRIFTVTGSDGFYDNGGQTYISEYDAAFNELGTKVIRNELESFGCFYSGETYNYIAYYQNNEEEDDNKEVIRIVKYDENFNRLASVSIKGGEVITVIPFDAACARMAEYANTLILHASRERYMTEDGYNHQSQLTIVINSDSMTLTDYGLGGFQQNHVSHSFNQFVRFDGRDWVLIDHGDAYPRSIVLHKWNSTTQRYTEANLFRIPGETGANCTGVSVGGFEISDISYIVAMNSVDHSKITSYGDFAMTGADSSERDIYILLADKNNISDVKQVKLTQCSGYKKTTSTPYLLKIREDVFAVLWEEYPYDSEMLSAEQKSLKYVYINANGEKISPVYTKDDMTLSADCDPVVIHNEIVWYVDSYDGWYGGGEPKRTFYTLPVDNVDAGRICIFNDVFPGMWYFDSVYTVNKMGLMIGTSPETFSPDMSVPLTHALVLACRLHNRLNSGSSFEQGGTSYQEYIDYAIAHEIIEKDDFTDYAAIATRAEVAYIFANAVPGIRQKSSNMMNMQPTDVLITDKYGEQIYDLYRAGILTGNDSTGTFNPNTHITRAQLAAVVTRIVSLMQ